MTDHQHVVAMLGLCGILGMFNPKAAWGLLAAYIVLHSM